MDTLDQPVEYAWRPRSMQQQAFIEWPGFEVVFGGSRGGGKTDASLGLNAIRAGKYKDAFRGLFIRKHLTDLEDAISRAKEIYFPIGADWHEQKKQFTFPGGGSLFFRYLKADKDAEKYQGLNLTDISIEELTQIGDPKPIFKLMASMRSAHGVPPQFRATCNPGGVGHSWVKTRYIDPAPLGFQPIIDEETGLDRVFIPSRVWDNRALMEADPGYINRLKMSAGGSQALLRAWLYGDWDAIEGAYFDNWNAEKHVIKPFSISKHWLRFRAMDWGSAVPFAVLWFAVSDGEEFETPDGKSLWFPKGSLIVYREYYGMPDGKPNVGLKLTAEQLCEGGVSTVDGQHHKGIVNREKGDEIKYGVASPDMFKQDGGPSVAERHFQCGVMWRRADNRRVARSGAIGGWDQVRQRLNGIDDQPMLYICSNCIHLIRTLPTMQHDPDRPEDMADGEDHACFAAGTLVATPDGDVPIEDIPAGYVQSWDGPAWTGGSSITKRQADIVEVEFSDGASIKCTPEHEFLTSTGWRKAVDLSDALCYVPISWNRKSSPQQYKSFAASASISAGLISAGQRAIKKALAFCTEKFGKRKTVQSLPDFTFTTRTMTDQTTNSIISNCSQRPSMSDIIQGWRQGLFLMPPEKRRLNGIRVTLEKLLAEGRMLLPKPSYMSASILPAGTADLRFALSSEPSIARTTANRRHVARPNWTQHVMRLAQFAANSSKRTNTSPRKHAVGRAGQSSRVVSVRDAGKADVYCIGVPSRGAFVLANGVIVSNCEALRYGCMSRPWVVDAPQESPVARGTTFIQAVKSIGQSRGGDGGRV